jgi:hypothetical protein
VERMKKQKRKEHISDYRIVVKNEKKTGITFEEILNSDSVKKIIEKWLIEY